MKHLDLFSGIGGFALGLKWVGGYETIGFCEIDKYCQKVLKKHWSDVPVYEDVTTLNYEQFTGQVDIITGGFPCQDISLAGRGAGLSGKRSGLYRHLVDALRVVRPRYAILENVAALLGRGMGTVLGDLVEIGYDAEWHCIPASSVGARHQRDRIWIVAKSNSTDGGRRRAHGQGEDEGWKESHTESTSLQSKDWETYTNNIKPGSKTVADTYSSRLKKWLFSSRSQSRKRQAESRQAAERDSWWETEPDVGRMANGIPKRVDRLRGLGNAVVPQIVEILGRAIKELDNENPHT